MSYVSSQDDFDKVKPRKLKIVLLGDKNVGKSSIIRRFMTNHFQEITNSTVGVDYMTKKLKYKNTNYKLELWDTAGQQKYRSLVKGYLKGADVCVFVYDVTKIDSYLTLIQWIRIFQQVSSINAVKIIASNKIDIFPEEGNQESRLAQQKKKQIKHKYSQILQMNEMPISAKTGFNIKQLFDQILHKSWVSRTICAIKTQRTLKNVKSDKEPKNTSCC